MSAFRGRTGVGTILLAVITAVMLAGASALPKQISTDWMRTNWKPASASDVRPVYELGSGVGTLDLSALRIPAGSSVATRAEVGAGQLKVVVPKDVTVELRMEVGVGDIQLPGERRQDFDVRTGQDRSQTLKPPTAPTAPTQPEPPTPPNQPEPPTSPTPPTPPTPPEQRKASKPAGTLKLHLEVGVGQVEVTRAEE